MEQDNTRLMIAAASRELRDNEIVFVGIGLPVLAAMLAKSGRAPNLKMIYEGGNIDCKPKNLPIHVADIGLVPNSAYAGSFDMTMGSYLQRGRIDVGFLGCAQIDIYGNMNTTVIGNYYKPKVRLPGSGGGNPIGSMAKRTIVLMRFGPNRFVKKVDYLTTPGYLTGPGSREAAGLPANTGPVCVISDVGIFRFHEQTKEMYLDRLLHSQDVGGIKEMVQWDLQVSSNLRVVEPLTPAELEILVRLDPDKSYLH
jgi:acyl CoA:acetate/3-ketoacid CoA transferase beta subunit